MTKKMHDYYLGTLHLFAMFQKLKLVYARISHLTSYTYRRVLYRPSTVEGEHNIRYYVQPYSALDNQIIRDGISDDWVIFAHLQKYIPDDGVIIDIGANAGFLTLPFAIQLVPKGQVYAYEPDPQIYDQLKKNTALNNLMNVKCIPKALQDDIRKNTTAFHIRRSIDGHGNSNRGLSSIINIPKHTQSHKTVTCSTLDAEVMTNDIDRISMIKIDVEGAEYKVLKGGRVSIERFQPIVFWEYSNVLDKLAANSNTIDTFFFLKKLGYRQYTTYDRHFQELKSPDTKLKDTNIIAIPSHISYE